jgi:acyl dehydratase
MMNFPSRFVGSLLKPYETKITWRRMMNYAAAIHDPNPCYFDDERPGGIVAHPMFCVAVTWPISERIWDYLEVADLPKDALMTQVHYTEHLQIHRLIRPGDHLIVKGQVVAIVPHKAGTHLVFRYDAYDQEDDPIFTEHIGGLIRGVPCGDKGRGETQIPRVPAKFHDGEPIWDIPIFIDRMMPYIYDGCADIYFPIHTSVKFARQVRLPDIILQGTASLALAVREVINREADRNPHRVKTVACRFTGMVIPGSEIRVQSAGGASDASGDQLFFTVLNDKGERAVSDGMVRLQE